MNLFLHDKSHQRQWFPIIDYTWGFLGNASQCEWLTMAHQKVVCQCWSKPDASKRGDSWLGFPKMMQLWRSMVKLMLGLKTGCSATPYWNCIAQWVHIFTKSYSMLFSRSPSCSTPGRQTWRRSWTRSWDDHTTINPLFIRYLFTSMNLELQ